VGPEPAGVCANPAALLAHVVLDFQLSTKGAVATTQGTPLVENPGVISATCTTAGDHTFLAISVKSEGLGAVTLSRALNDVNARAPSWGLHALRSSSAG